MKATEIFNEDLKIKKIKKNEIDLADPSADEVKALNADSPAKKEKVLKKVEKDMKESYSAKEAHKGKDIGKPGKNFDKIAKSAGKEYGSKKAGERVAGAILAKLRNESLKEGLTMYFAGQINEDLKPSMGLPAYIDDFVHSNDSRFSGKSKEERINMAKGAFYGAQQNESVEPSGFKPGDKVCVTNPQATPQHEIVDSNDTHYTIKKPNGNQMSLPKERIHRVNAARLSPAVEEAAQPAESVLQAAKDFLYALDRGYLDCKDDSEFITALRTAVDNETSQGNAVEEAVENNDSEFSVSITIPLLVRCLEWARESAGEDLQLHKFVEAIENLYTDGTPLDSNDYEQIIAQVTANDPSINDDGPEAKPESGM